MRSSDLIAHAIPAPRFITEAIIARAVLSLVLIWGGAVKVASPDEFGVVVWRIAGRAINPTQAVSLGVLLAILELTVALALIFGLRRRVWIAAAVLLLAGFSAVLVRLMTMPDAPSCGCLSAPGLRAHPYEHAVGIVRNFALIWICWIAWRSVENEHEAQAMAPAWRLLSR